MEQQALTKKAGYSHKVYVTRALHYEGLVDHVMSAPGSRKGILSYASIEVLPNLKTLAGLTRCSDLLATALLFEMLFYS